MTAKIKPEVSEEESRESSLQSIHKSICEINECCAQINDLFRAKKEEREQLIKRLNEGREQLSKQLKGELE